MKFQIYLDLSIWGSVNILISIELCSLFEPLLEIFAGIFWNTN